MAGTKRKAESAKGNNFKGTKKPKVDAVRNEARTPKTSKPYVKPTSREPEEEDDSSEDDFGDINDDGGVVLVGISNSETDLESPVPKGRDGVHPDRAKAVVNGTGPNGTLDPFNMGT
jgi:hypothetical protein